MTWRNLEKNLMGKIFFNGCPFIWVKFHGQIFISWTSVENYQIVIIFCLHYICSLHSLVQLFELITTTNIYWPIECLPRASFVGVFELARIYVCLLTIWVHSKNSFNMGVFKFARISRTSIGYLNATQKIHLLVHEFKVDKKKHIRTCQKIEHTKAFVDVM